MGDFFTALINNKVLICGIRRMGGSPDSENLDLCNDQ